MLFTKKEIITKLQIDEDIVDECLEFLIKKKMILNNKKFKLDLECALFLEELIKKETDSLINLLNVLSIFSTLILAIASLLSCKWITFLAAFFSVTTFIYMIFTLADN